MRQAGTRGRSLRRMPGQRRARRMVTAAPRGSRGRRVSGPRVPRWGHDRAAAPAPPTPTTLGSPEHIELTEQWAAHNYHPLPVVHQRGAGLVGHRRRGAALPRLPRRILRAQLRPRSPAAARRGALPARPAHTDQPGVLQRPARPVRPRPRRADRQGHGAADEQRRRGGRDRDQDQPSLGLRGQGGAAGPRHDHRDGRQLPRPHHDDHQLLHRRGRPARLRAVHAGLHGW